MPTNDSHPPGHPPGHAESTGTKGSPRGPDGGGTGSPARAQTLDVVEQAGDHAVFVLDLQARVQSWNAGAERITGYGRAEMVGKHISLLYGAAELRKSTPEREMRAAADAGRAETEGWWVRRDGSRLWGRRTLVPLRGQGGEPVGFGGVVCDLTANREVQRRLEEREQCYRSLFDHNPDAVYSFDLEGKFTSANAGCETVTGYRGQELLGMPFLSLVEPEHREAAQAAFERAARGEPQTVEVAVRRKDGARVELQSVKIPIVVRDQVAGIFAISRDVTERKRAEAELRESEERFRLIVEGGEQGFFYVIDDRHRFRYVSPSVRRVIGYTPEELIGRPIEELLTWEPTEPAAAHESGDAGAEPPQTMTVAAVHKSGERVILELVESPARTHGEVVGMQGYARDVTRQKQMERQLVHNALHDGLTGLANRALFWDRLAQTVRLAERYPERLFSVLMLDLDRFKLVNDTLGHMVGDQLLVGVARRLERCVRPGDTVGRLGGDEFILLLDEMRDVSDATRVARRIEKAFDEPFRLGSEYVFCTASVGIALSATGYESPDELVRNADTALYRAKALGTARYEVFDRAMRASTLERLQLESDLRRALERGEFRVDYQPIVSLATGRIWAFEALVRWHHATRGVILPADFVPIAEETGQIVAIDLWVLREACGQLHAWQERYPGFPLKVSVNLSGKQFLHQDLVQQIHRILEQTQVDALSLKLEITESVLAEKAESSAAILQQLKTMDVHLQIDDFGTGYSSLSYLQQFPVDTLKIDRSFVSRNGGNAEIIRAVVSLAHSLDLTVVAEGVETPEQLARMIELDCDYAQGFVFSHPLTGSEAEAMIASGPTW